MPEEDNYGQIFRTPTVGSNTATSRQNAQETREKTVVKYYQKRITEYQQEITQLENALTFNDLSEVFKKAGQQRLEEMRQILNEHQLEFNDFLHSISLRAPIQQ